MSSAVHNLPTTGALQLGGTAAGAPPLTNTAVGRLQQAAAVAGQSCGHHTQPAHPLLAMRKSNMLGTAAGHALSHCDDACSLYGRPWGHTPSAAHPG